MRIVTSTTATGPDDDGTVSLVGPGGIDRVRPTVIVLATGARERPRAARLVPGDRPAGVFTTGQLQQWVSLRGLPVGRRAVVVGAEHVAYSAVLTLRHAGVRTVAMVTDLPRHQTLAAFAAATRFGLRVPLRTDSRVTGLHGHGRIRAVDVEHRGTGVTDRILVDTVVFTGDWIPDHELARRAGLALQHPGGGPATDLRGRTSRSGVLAAGGLVHPGGTAGLAALDGRRVGRLLAGSWTSSGPHAAAGSPLAVAGPVVSVVPAVVDPGEPPERLFLRTDAFTGARRVVVRQGGAVVGEHRLRHATPHRSLPVPGSIVGALTADGGAVEVSLV